MNQFAQVVSMCSFFVGCVATTATSAPHLVTKTSSIQVAQVKQSKPTIEDNDFKFELQGCQRSGSRVRCNFLITNLADVDRVMQLSAFYGKESSSRIIDVSGNEYWATVSQLGQAQQANGNPVKVKLIRGIPMKGSLFFEGVPQQVNKLAVIETAYIFVNPYNIYRSVQFRDVTIQSK